MNHAILLTIQWMNFNHKIIADIVLKDDNLWLTNENESKATCPLTLSFRLVRNLSLFSEGFPTRSTCGNDKM